MHLGSTLRELSFTLHHLVDLIPVGARLDSWSWRDLWYLSSNVSIVAIVSKRSAPAIRTTFYLRAEVNSGGEMSVWTQVCEW